MSNISTLVFDPAHFARSTIGLDEFRRRMATARSGTYPPHNIEQIGDHAWVLTLAVAGFSREEISITVHDNVLIIASDGPSNEIDPDRTFLHRAISFKPFERVFPLGEHVEVGAASLKNGLLSVVLRKIAPATAQPRVIPIS